MINSHYLTVLKLSIVLLVCLIGSVVTISGFLDPDFFTQYYIGKGIIGGESMYGGFTDNKGPIFYLFFAGLYRIFGNNYGLALGGGSFILYWAVIWGVLRLVETDERENQPITLSKEIMFLVVTGAYLVFSFTFQGLFSENLGMAFLVWSAVWGKRNKNFVAGLLFAGAVFSRQTLVFFLPYIGYLILINKGSVKKNFAMFVGGIGVIVTIVLGGLVMAGEFRNYLFNTVSFNLNYAQAIRGQKLNSIARGVYDAGFYRPLLGIVSMATAVVWSLLKNKKKGLEVLILLTCSLVAIFGGGMVYIHHFFQLALMAGVGFRILIFEFEYKFINLGMMLVILIAVFSWNFLYMSNIAKGDFDTLTYKADEVEEIRRKNYLMVATFHPKLYFDYQKTAPDKYFQPFFISDIYNIEANREQSLHRQQMKFKLTETAFVFIRNTKINSDLADNYLKIFGKDFKLKKVGERQLPGAMLEIYWSSE